MHAPVQYMNTILVYTLLITTLTICIDILKKYIYFLFVCEIVYKYVTITNCFLIQFKIIITQVFLKSSNSTHNTGLCNFETQQY